MNIFINISLTIMTAHGFCRAVLAGLLGMVPGRIPSFPRLSSCWGPAALINGAEQRASAALTVAGAPS